LITTRQILEAYLNYIKPVGLKDSIAVFVNPDSSEIKELRGWIKFIADAKKKAAYVWDLEGGLHHIEVIEHLDLGIQSLQEKHLLVGVAEREGASYVIQFFDLMQNYKDHMDLRNRLKRYNWSWMGKYHFNMEQFRIDAEQRLPGLYRGKE
jgi:hypothetical protein